MLILAFGSFLWALPHFIVDASFVSSESLNHTPTHLCHNFKEDECEITQGSPISFHWIIFMFGQFLQGVGCAPLIALGTALLDQSVEKRSSPLYISIFQAFQVIGPALGYLLGGSFLFIHTDLSKYITK